MRGVSLEPAHGYGIAQHVQHFSHQAVQLNQGSLYPALHRLEQKRWLKSIRSPAPVNGNRSRIRSVNGRRH